jgi:cytochrome oxidase Cu insertion factor (SCO1/SenC/PrrC family)
MMAAFMLAAMLGGSATADHKPTSASKRLPAAMLIDERGQKIRLDAFAGKVLIVSFFSTNGAAASTCTAIAGKFLYLQRHLSSREFHLIQISRDPRHDSPQRLRAYAQDFGAISSAWSFLTGDARQIAGLARAMGALKTKGSSPDEPLFILDGYGRVAASLPAGDWSPDDAITLARTVSSAR